MDVCVLGEGKRISKNAGKSGQGRDGAGADILYRRSLGKAQCPHQMEDFVWFCPIPHRDVTSCNFWGCQRRLSFEYFLSAPCF